LATAAHAFSDCGEMIANVGEIEHGSGNVDERLMYRKCKVRQSDARGSVTLDAI
jgi:hypothetical protein